MRTDVEDEARGVVEREELHAVRARQLEDDPHRVRTVLRGPHAVHLLSGDGARERGPLEHRRAQVERDPARAARRGRKLELLPADPVREVDRDARVVVGRPGSDLGDAGGAAAAGGPERMRRRRRRREVRERGLERGVWR